MRQFTVALLPAMTALVVSSCNEPNGVACTTELRAIPLDITTSAGAPADSVDLAVALVRTGEILEHVPPTHHPEGAYVLIDDDARTKLRPTGDQVRAVATKEAARTQADFLIDVPGGCHVQKVSGPDTIALP